MNEVRCLNPAQLFWLASGIDDHTVARKPRGGGGFFSAAGFYHGPQHPRLIPITFQSNAPSKTRSVVSRKDMRLD